MLKSLEELKEYYNSLNSEYEGYIQMSDNRIEKVFQTPSKLPSWQDLHNDINYILELVLFEPNSRTSILVRNQNDKWIKKEHQLSDEDMKNIDSFYTLQDGLKMKIAQIWEEEKNEFCLGFKELRLKYLMFAGFVKDKK